MSFRNKNCGPESEMVRRLKIDQGKQKRKQKQKQKLKRSSPQTQTGKKAECSPDDDRSSAHGTKGKNPEITLVLPGDTIEKKIAREHILHEWSKGKGKGSAYYYYPSILRTADGEEEEAKRETVPKLEDEFSCSVIMGRAISKDGGSVSEYSNFEDDISSDEELLRQTANVKKVRVPTSPNPYLSDTDLLDPDVELVY